MTNLPCLVDIPWDSRVLDKKCYQIISPETSIEALEKLLSKIPSESYIFSRADSNNLELKKTFIQNHFYISELSAIVFCPNISLSLPNVRYKKLLPLERSDYSSNDCLLIQEAARGSFKHGRFDEDPFVTEQQKEKRMNFWITDLLERKTPVLTFRKDNKILSFMFYKTEDDTVELILGGSEAQSGIYTPFFWYSVFSELAKSGIRKVKTRISLVNTPILNLYIQFGFKVVNSEYAFVRHY